MSAPAARTHTAVEAISDFGHLQLAGYIRLKILVAIGFRASYPRNT